MGARRPPLPAPTDFSSTDNASALGPTMSDLATDLTTRTDKTHYSIPEDGSPVTITTKSGKGTKDSQTSLLIEYFEGGKNGDNPRSRPSVRVRVTPSSSKRSKGAHDHIQITETGKNRKPSYTRRISLPNARSTEGISSHSDDSLHRPPIEVEVLHNGSELSQSDLSPTRFVPLPSEISSMPADSMLDGHLTPRGVGKGVDRSADFEEVEHSRTTMDTLAAPAIKRSRSASRERIAQLAVEKLRKERVTASRERGKDVEGSRRSSSREQLYEVVSGSGSPRRRSITSRGDDRSTLQPSELSTASRISDRSMRSGGSNISVNNPKLLNAVEDAIKRLILPELTALKEEQKHQKNLNRFDDAASLSRGASTLSRDETRRTSLSKTSSLPNVSKPSVYTDDRGEVVKGEDVRVRKTRRSSRGSASERSERDSSASGTHRDDYSRSRRRVSKEKPGLKHTATATAGAALIGLTAANLRHHDSASSLEERERRKKRTKHRSRSRGVHDSVDESAMTSTRHETAVPPLPLQSTLTSDLTRDSILSAETERPRSAASIRTRTPVKDKEIREVVRNSPYNVTSPGPLTPVRSPLSLRDESHEERHSMSRGSPRSERSTQRRLSPKALGAGAGLAAAAAAYGLHEHHHDHESEDFAHNRLTPHRDVSPVQSDASFQQGSADVLQHSRVRSIRSDHSMGSPRRSRQTLSPEPAGGATSPNGYSYKKLDQHHSTAGAYEILPEDEYHAESPYQSDFEEELERQHEENEHYREQYRSELGISEPSEIGTTHRESYAQDDYDDQYTDEEDQNVQPVGANPEYVRTPLAVESAVASLHDPSMIDSPSQRDLSPDKGLQHGVLAGRGMPVQPLDPATGLPTSKDRFSLIRDQALNSAAKYKQGGIIEGSPQLGSMKSFDSQPKMGASAIPLEGDEMMPEIGHGDFDDEGSDMLTNPSVIDEPLGGKPHGDRAHWPYQPTPSPKVVHERTHHNGHDAALLGGAAAAAAAGAVGLGVAHHQITDSDLSAESQKVAPRDLQQPMAEHDYMESAKGMPYDDIPQPTDTTPQHLKDEGYHSTAHAGLTPTPLGFRDIDDQSLGDYPDGSGVEDPFTIQKHLRHESGMSHGMGSPIYDSATGKGMDRIQSKDIVALMDHLTVRDAQRNARDTEILVTLVRSAAEMRNSFEEMKRFIADQHILTKQNGDRNADVTVQKILGGPRPIPAGKSSPRTARSQASDESEARTKKANVLRRLMKGFNSKNSNELTKIEDMLMQLLVEVESLKHTQQVGVGVGVVGRSVRSGSLNSYEQLRATADSGYEPEGRASTAATSNNQSGHLSLSSQRQLNGIMHSGYERHASDGNRISTVHEDDEDFDDIEPQQQRSSPYQTAEEEQGSRTPTPTQNRRTSANKDSFDAPRDRALRRLNGQQGPEDTPNSGKQKKHKSGVSAIFAHLPKVSRWSKTTASSAPDNGRASEYRDKRPSLESSRTGSSASINRRYAEDDDYGLQEEDRLRSKTSLPGRTRGGSEPPRSPSPLIPGDEMYEDPKYQAHRNSLNLQHPQPRQGTTHRHQTHLESQAVNFEHPSTPDADLFGNTPSLNRNHRFSTASNQVPVPKTYSPAHSEGGYSDGGYSAHSASEQAHNQYTPYQPSKLRDDGPLVPTTNTVKKSTAGTTTTANKPTKSTDTARSNEYKSTSNNNNSSSTMHYGSPIMNTAVHIPSPLEPIQEVRYSLETDRNSVRNQATPSPQPAFSRGLGVGSSPRSPADRKVTPAGPREMPGGIRRKPVGGGAPVATTGGAKTYRSMSPESLQSYQGSTESETF